MKNIKNVLVATFFAASAASVFPAEASGIGCFPWCSSKSAVVSQKDLAHVGALTQRKLALDRICALQNKAADKKCVRAYKHEDFRKACAVLTENGFPEYYLDEDEHKILVYEERGEIKGVSISSPVKGEIYLLSVGRSYKRQGVGSALVYANMYAMKKNHNVGLVSLISKTEAKPFYEKLGFTFVGDTGSYSLK